MLLRQRHAPHFYEKNNCSLFPIPFIDWDVIIHMIWIQTHTTSCRQTTGEVAERLNAAHSKCALGQLNGGSNPPLSVYSLVVTHLEPRSLQSLE